MRTELLENVPEMHPIWSERVPMKKLGQPADLIGAYLFLASDASRYATGSDVVVDGGYTCPWSRILPEQSL